MCMSAVVWAGIGRSDLRQLDHDAGGGWHRSSDDRRGRGARRCAFYRSHIIGGNLQDVTDALFRNRRGRDLLKDVPTESPVTMIGFV